MDAFISWFKSRNGALDTEVMSLTDIPGQGRGAVALKDIPEGHTLFSIPRDITLSTRTSALPALLGNVEWKRFKLDEGWPGLILCMLWEEAQGPLSKWSEYLSILPTQFDTPMFWTEDELEELKGTSVVDKIGKDDAERDFHEKVMPTIESRPELFPQDSILLHYTLEKYHLMGSRILSRSFIVSRWSGENEDDEGAEQEEATVSSPGSMEVDGKRFSVPPSDAEDPETRDSDEDDDEDPSDVAMVPMADMLNARFESENAKLFYEEHELKMITTKVIKAGEQIYNTYGDPPNSDLLRRYGHVDLIPLSPPLTGEGNPEDVVEVRGDLIVEAVSKQVSGDYSERVDWWLENAEDDTFLVDTNCELPPDLISFTRLLLQPQAEWEKTRSKSKLPKATLDSDISAIAISVLEKRLTEYPTTVEEDEAILAKDDLTVHKRSAVIVRLGEKRILNATLSELRKSQEALNSTRDKNKRKAGHHRSDTTHAASGSHKKARR